MKKGIPDDHASLLLMNGNFWGRSITGSGACDDPGRYKHFGPHTPGFDLVDYNDSSLVEDHLKSNPHCVAVMLEGI